MVNDKDIGAYESNSDKQKDVEARERIDAEQVAFNAAETTRKINGDAYFERLQDSWDAASDPRTIALAKEKAAYAGMQFDEVVGSGLYKDMLDPAYQVEAVLKLLSSSPAGDFGEQMKACRDILKQYQK
jgi:hypothetical protein